MFRSFIVPFLLLSTLAIGAGACAPATDSTSSDGCLSAAPVVRFQAGDDVDHYIGTQSFSALQCQLGDRVNGDLLNPIHRAWSNAAYSFAHDLAVWVSRVLDVPTVKLKFAYYANVRQDETKTPCLATPNGPYAPGGGAPLCQLIEDVTRLEGLSHFLTALLDYGHRTDVNGDANWHKYAYAPALEARVADLGFKPFVDFAYSFDTSFVYNPRVDPYGEMVSLSLASQPPGWFGSSGGGGSGAGFEIFCQDEDGSNQVTLVTGGGGGGGGMSSPENARPVQAGGGGGGGVQVGIKGLPRVGAGMGNHPYGFLDVKSDVDPDAFALAMEQVIADMKACHAAPGRVVALRGGGGGGGGWETYLEWDMSDPRAQAEERVPHGMSAGYGFQFALGEQVKLTPNAGNGELPFAVCPYGTTEVLWQECLDPPPSDEAPAVTARPEQTDESPGTALAPAPEAPSSEASVPEVPDYAAINAVFSCASTIATRMCGLAEYADAVTGQATPYGAYASYASCNCPISNMYQKAYLPDAPPWNVIPQACSYGESAPTDMPLVPPEVTEAMIKAHPEWCQDVAGCSQVPACENSPGSPSPSNQDSSA